MSPLGHNPGSVGHSLLTWKASEAPLGWRSCMWSGRGTEVTFKGMALNLLGLAQLRRLVPGIQS